MLKFIAHIMLVIKKTICQIGLLQKTMNFNVVKGNDSNPKRLNYSILFS